MPITGSELKMYRSALVSDVAATNGGVMSNNEVVSAVNNNIFPDAPQSERMAGSTKYRKVFFKNTNSANLALLNPRVYLDKYTQGDDAVYFMASTQTELQSEIGGSPKLYGAGKLDVNAAAGATTLKVLIESASRQFFANGDVIRISNRPTVNAAGQEEFITVSGAPTIAGSVVTLTLATPLANSYLAADTRVANVLSAGATLAPSLTGSNVATVGNGDLAFGSVTLGNLGTVYDQWTLTFTSSTAFTIEGVRSGSLGSGNTLADSAPANPNSGTPYFTIPAAAFSGAWAAGDTATFTTVPANIPLMAVRIIPTGAAAIAGNKFTIAIDGETA